VSPDVIVCGAGVAGLATAKALHGNGLRVLVLDRQRETPQVAKGELLQPEAVRILDGWGALPLLEDIGAVAVDRLAIRDPHGGLLLDLDYSALSGPYRTVRCATYPAILEMLERSLGPQVEVRRGVLVKEPLRDATGRVVGVRVAHEGTESELRAPLVVAADGPSSRLRDGAGLTARRDAYPHRLLAVELSTVEVDAEICAYSTQRGLRLVYPLPGGRCRFYAQVEPDEWRAGKAPLPDEWCDRLMAEVPAVAPLDAALRKAFGTKQVLGVYRLRAPRLHAPGLALVGESAHAVHPMAAQGMNSSLADAETLAARVRDAGGIEAGALDRALAGYQQQRIGRLDHTATVSHNAARMLTLPPGLARTVGRRMMRNTAANPRLVRLTTGNLSGVALAPLRPVDRLYQFGLLRDRRATLLPEIPTTTGGARP
jgi:2-polyprenyl-6-methoxyphenol hydroxylase-like FAD-dependent oxidoreductase